MRYKSKIVLLFLLINGSFLFSQESKTESTDMTKITEDTLITRVVDCNALFTLNNRKIDYLRKKPYVYTEPYYERAYNSKKDYAVFQVGKRKGTRPFLYIRMFTFNTCIKQDEVLEFILENGYRYRIENIYDPNCDGFFVAGIRNKDIKVLTQGVISSVKLLTFEKDYEFHLSEEESERMKDELQCLKYNNFKFR
jgi:hypothetical protein